MRLFGVTAPGLAELAAGELSALGQEAAAGQGGVEFEAELESLYRVNLRLRTVSRVLVRAASFRARTFFELERRAGRVDWERYVGPGRAVRLRVTSRKSRLYHEGAVAERFLTAIDRRAGPVVAAGAPGGAAEPEDDGADAQLIVVRFLRDECTVSMDTSGDLLHQRGYRQAVAKAPLRETLAAAALMASGWAGAGRVPLLDPFCGSGTIPIEAALLARRIAPGLASKGLAPRSYAFQQWPDFDEAVWRRVVEAARADVLPGAGAAIHGSDRDAGAVAAAESNAARAGVSADVAFDVRPLSALERPSLPESGAPVGAAGSGWLVTNPPYGVRVGERDRLRDLYAALGRVARERLAGWTVALLSADRRLDAQVGLRLEESLRTTNGGIPVRLVVGRVPA